MASVFLKEDQSDSCDGVATSHIVLATSHIVDKRRIKVIVVMGS